MVSFKSLLVTSTLACTISCAPAAAYYTTVRSIGSGKRGLAYNSNGLLAAFNGGLFSWSYNWDPQPWGDTAGTEFVPMLWGPRVYGSWNAAAEAAVAAGSENLLAFNEPDIVSQANMSPEAAAEAYQHYMNPFAGRARLGSPAVSNGGPPMGLSWMQRFLDVCAGNCKIDFLAVHWYSPAEYVDDFKRYVGEAIALGQKYGIGTVWVTEFEGQGDAAAQVNFLREVLPWLDSNPGVERYAYSFVDKLAAGGALTSVSQAYRTI
ncbi:hypothetical protein GX51_06850 [Blastomyces parvus]|uniref:Asl1-like glycosyl hydrolase catalytic domain-containing protein n=1 Tax=Blastomyces parvus TaxID=2060905 RepID=A0A2B7WGA2_9EURO|nr:hypothetical protein GX51_06850 [Blastomyces parvus]